jgi:hypothetical protein
MDTDKIKIIIMNMEMLLKELKYEMNGILKGEPLMENIEESSSSLIHDYDEVFDD